MNCGCEPAVQADIFLPVKEAKTTTGRLIVGAAMLAVGVTLAMRFFR